MFDYNFVELSFIVLYANNSNILFYLSFRDKLSGKDFKRLSYQRLRKKLNKGDVLVIKYIDRLGCNYEEIQIEW